MITFDERLYKDYCFTRKLEELASLHTERHDATWSGFKTSIEYANFVEMMATKGYKQIYTMHDYSYSNKRADKFALSDLYALKHDSLLDVGPIDIAQRIHGFGE